MDEGRKQRGEQIATRQRIRRTNNGWIVPSQSGAGKYAVAGDGDARSCTCPDWETNGGKCKHIFAVEYVIQQQLNLDGSTTVTETVRITETVERKTYPQNWAAYNSAQTNEGDKFQALLRDLVAGLPEPEPGRGRPRLSLADSILAASYKAYSTFSARRFMSELREAHARGYISKVPHFNSVLNALENPQMTPILRDLIMQSSLPLTAVELDFAVDSSGFTTCRFESWFDHKYGVTRRKHTWVKAHVITGVKTNIVTAIEIHGPVANDGTQLPALVNATAKHFAISEVSGDKAYGTIKNTETIARLGATPLIPFKTVHTGRGTHRNRSVDTSAWAKAVAYFMYHREEFLERYHKRSNVESTFSMIKRKFGGSLRSKTETAQVNEVLAKILCHNLVVLIHEMYESGIDPVFGARQTAAQQRPVWGCGGHVGAPTITGT